MLKRRSGANDVNAAMFSGMMKVTVHKSKSKHQPVGYMMDSFLRMVERSSVPVADILLIMEDDGVVGG